MSKVINIVGDKSNVGKTFVMEGIIKELKRRGLSVATIKHDIHGFDIDKKGKDTYKHREAGSETVIISSPKRFALIKEVKEEIPLEKIINLAKDKDVILVEGYKKSTLRKIEVYKKGFSDRIISPKEKLIAIASDEDLNFEDILVVKKDDFKKIVDLILQEKDYKI
ncbi:MAG: molybdopterin-guanine dinucleotide biosynthesis protein B [Clostridium sp.]|jgi:molybdopterin-guanine dinucleotide biosynthesis protein B|uniref:molybdopterin-guanine dinucleotide biosynthesis protein B n=1 Tax=Clostridium sp. TaxID=1506 RepID=UPI0025C5F625|nr:molybdopterin-guanine dinucleotide biosynthesis protein B [Clostridium sp.]MCI6693563.1 molybdopterin-guanine dinucleotide biosynthesis protein B [Clostridium sp.]MDY2631156.1 molybdopterin-guanine dinucleotide biosynthesis protein B [Clostridium sp.]MDY4252268.1 molybdopterin-guanine dinucleotide biosynthesis protein B [Clostridium sp.]